MLNVKMLIDEIGFAETVMESLTLWDSISLYILFIIIN